MEKGLIIIPWVTLLIGYCSRSYAGERLAKRTDSSAKKAGTFVRAAAYLVSVTIGALSQRIACELDRALVVLALLEPMIELLLLPFICQIYACESFSEIHFCSKIHICALN